MVNNTAITIVILNNRNLLVYFVLTVVTEQNKRGTATYNLKQYSFKILFLGVVHFRGSPFGESMGWGSVFCPSPNFYSSVTSKPEDGLQ